MYRLSIAAFLLALVLVSPANCTTLYVMQMHTGLWEQVDLYFKGPQDSDLQVHTEWAGAVDAKISKDGGRTFRLPFLLFCVDLFTNVYVPSSFDVVYDPATVVVNGGRVSWLYMQNVKNISTPDMGAALQIAIWDIIIDGGDGLGENGGTFRAATTTPAPVVTLAEAYIASSAGKSSSEATVFTDVRGASQTQRLLGAEWDNPEPGTFLLAGGALILLTRCRLKRDK